MSIIEQMAWNYASAVTEESRLSVAEPYDHRAWLASVRLREQALADMLVQIDRARAELLQQGRECPPLNQTK